MAYPGWFTGILGADETPETKTTGPLGIMEATRPPLMDKGMLLGMLLGNVGAGILAGNKRGGTFGEAMGQGLQQGMLTTAVLMPQLLKQQKEAKAQEAMKAFLTETDPAKKAQYAAILNPTAATKGILEGNKPYTIKPGEQRRGPNNDLVLDVLPKPSADKVVISTDEAGNPVYKPAEPGLPAYQKPEKDLRERTQIVEMADPDNPGQTKLFSINKDTLQKTPIGTKEVGATLTPEAIDYHAWMGLITDKNPSFGMGKAGMPNRTAVQNRMGELAAGDPGDVAAKKAKYKALS